MKKSIFTLGAALLLFSACSNSTESSSTSDSTLVATDSTQVSDSLQVKAGEIKSTEEVN
jgi:uncharacterized protein YcfL